MSTLTLRPASDNTNEGSQWANEATGYTNLYISVDEVVLSETDYIQISAGISGAGDYDMKFNWPNHTTESGTINSVKVYAQVKKFNVGSGSTSPKLYLFAIDSDHRTEITVTTSSAQQSVTWSTNPHTSSAWTWTDIDNLLAGHAASATGGDAKNYTMMYVYQIYAEVDYTVSGWANIAKINGVASSSIAKVDGVAVASIAKINGTAV